MSDTNLQGAHDFVYNQTINVVAESGLEKLLKASMRDAFHDAGARDPPRCHPGTRLDYIDKISTWGSGTSQHPEHILWMEGPAGVGKSAVAQSCAELLAKQDQLGAAFFFSRPNERDDPKRLFPSLSYQITTISDAYADILDRKLQRNPAILEKSLAGQFDELLVKPLEELRGVKKGVRDYVIIIDGLDECDGVEAQEEIVEIIARSVQNTTTPFRWAFFSRPESHITASFASDLARPLCLHLELPVSRKFDHEILCYLLAEFEEIRKKHGLSSSWPSEGDLGALVDRAAGLFIYASTVIRFVGERNSLGPVDQLQLVLLRSKEAADSDHPLSELDLFYTLIMRRIPSKVLSKVQNILLLHASLPEYGRAHSSYYYANVFSLSEAQFRNVCAALHSVLKLQANADIEFYHASFMDFLKDSHRSQEFCIYGDCLDTVRQELLEHLNRVHAQSIAEPSIDITWSHFNLNNRGIYEYLVDTFFRLCRYPRPLTSLTASGLVAFQFRAIPRLYFWGNAGGGEISPSTLRENIPIELRDKVIRRAHNPAVYFVKPKRAQFQIPYVLGQGNNRVLWWSGTGEMLTPYPSIFEIVEKHWHGVVLFGRKLIYLLLAYLPLPFLIAVLFYFDYLR